MLYTINKLFVVMARIMGGLTDNTYLKATAGMILSLLSFFFDPATKMALLALLCLIMADCLSSLIAIRKTGVNKRGRPLASSSLMGSAVKTAVYFLMIASGFMAEKAVPISFIDDTIIGFLAVTELVSILENCGRAGYAIPKKLLGKLTAIRDED